VGSTAASAGKVIASVSNAMVSEDKTKALVGKEMISEGSRTSLYHRAYGNFLDISWSHSFKMPDAPIKLLSDSIYMMPQ